MERGRFLFWRTIIRPSFFDLSDGIGINTFLIHSQVLLHADDMVPYSTNRDMPFAHQWVSEDLN